jgi:hypothetical protein
VCLRRFEEKPVVSGHCNCGSVGFEFDGDPAGVFVCHCSICRRSTGANGIAVVLVPKGAFRWTRGEDQAVKWSKPNSHWDTWFCKTCGSRLPGENDAERIFIPAGLLPGSGLGLQVAENSIQRDIEEARPQASVDRGSSPARPAIR